MMAAIFKADDYLLPTQMGICSYLTNTVTVSHCHDYYELFVVQNGSAKHVTQAGVMPVASGTLCLIRPGDTHSFISGHCEMFNLLVRKELWRQLADFLGPSDVMKTLLSAELPVQINLRQEDFESVRNMLEADIFTPHSSIDNYNSHLKVAVLSLLEKFFAYPLLKTEAMPQWLDTLLKEMHDQSNYAEGMEAMYRISGYSPEHLCRSFKRYLDTTPTAYLNTLRIQEAGRYLVYTDEPIIDIASRCGFNSLSYFYHLFKEVYKLSPMKHRKLHKLQRSPA